MAFTPAFASLGERNGKLLSADNSRPERHIVIETLRQAATLIGLKAPVIATLDAMLSCLPPTRQHNTVFASNATLAFRRNGISDRTIRRHVVILQELGFLVRRDSSNRKRFSRQNMTEGTTLRFGFDLTPLFQRFAELAKLAAEANREKEQIAYIKAKIRAAANEMLRSDPDNIDATMCLRALRRNLSLDDCHELLRDLEVEALEAEQASDKMDFRNEEMSGNGGQNVRHHHNSNKENTDIKDPEQIHSLKKPSNDIQLTVSEIVTSCPEAMQFSNTPVRTMTDVITHARTLAPMLGIDSRNYQKAQENIGIEGAALTVWAIMQFHEKIRKVGAYFRSITSGKNSTNFIPEQLVRRLAQSHPMPI